MMEFNQKPEDLLSRQILLTNIQPPSPHETNKVTIVGVGDVGMACAFSILTQGITNSVCLTDTAKNKMLGEMLDLQHGSVFMEDAKITSGTDYSVTAGSRISIITAGVRQRDGEPLLNLVQRNVEIMKTIIPQVVKHSPNTLLLVVTNPVDIMTYVAWKLSGFPKHRVIGAGTNLDSSRFRFLLSQKLGIAATDCEGWIIGEHGDSSVAVWSSVNFAGVRLRELNPKAGLDGDPENWADVHKAVNESVYQVIKRKGYTNWAIGFSVAAIVRSILENIGDLHAVSVYIQGLHGVKEDVFLSLPTVVGGEGVRDVVNQHLDKFELAALHKSAEVLSKVQSDLVI